MGEAGELLLALYAGVDCDRTSGQAELFGRAWRPEIAGPKEGQPVAVARSIHDAKPGIACVRPQLLHRIVGGGVEHRRIITQGHCMAVFDQRDFNRLFSRGAEREELHPGIAGQIAPYRPVFLEARLVEGVIVDLVGAGMMRRFPVGLSREPLGAGNHHFP